MEMVVEVASVQCVIASSNIHFVHTKLHSNNPDDGRDGISKFGIVVTIHLLLIFAIILFVESTDMYIVQTFDSPLLFFLVLTVKFDY